MRTLPTERLANVVNESADSQAMLQAMRIAISQILRDWGIMPQEAIMAELRELLDKANVIQPFHTTEALVYLRMNEKRLNQSRNRSRRGRGIDAPRDTNLGFVDDHQSIASRPVFSLEEIEKKLAGLSIVE